MHMERLPDDLWLRIFEVGIDKRILDHADLCSLAMTCHHFDQLTENPTLWAALLAQNFLSNLLSDQRPSKSLFRAEFEKMKDQEHEMEEMFDEVIEFVMWLDNHMLDEAETSADNNTIRCYTQDQARSANAAMSDTDRSNHACSNSIWTTFSTILFPKRHSHQVHASRLPSEEK